MKSILTEIIDNKKHEVQELKKLYSYKDFEQMEHFSRDCYSMESSLLSNPFGIIAEIKRKSPSAGSIQPDIDLISFGKMYEKEGVAGISCLTDQQYFGGSQSDLLMLRSACRIPLLRKEFIIDELQIFESKALGADSILLIAEVLEAEQALYFTILAQSLGMEVIMEFHSPDQFFKINDHVNIIGINNRDLKRQRTSLEISQELIKFIPSERTCISESGIRTTDELIMLRSIGFKGALIGESILKNEHPAQFLSQLKETV
jgi:indole-3-glycerol phosphate synthase